MTAADHAIKEVSIQANALDFIMNNADDYDNEELKAKILLDCEQLIKTSVSGKFTNLRRCTELVRNGILTAQHIKLISDIVFRLNQNGFEMIELRFDDFQLVLQEQTAVSKLRQCTWKTIMKAFDFQEERKRIQI